MTGCVRRVSLAAIVRESHDNFSVWKHAVRPRLTRSISDSIQRGQILKNRIATECTRPEFDEFGARPHKQDVHERGAVDAAQNVGFADDPQLLAEGQILEAPDLDSVLRIQSL